jgi:hypothetical protein
VVFVVIAVGVSDGRAPFGALGCPIAAGLFLYALWRSLLAPQMDKVCIDDDELVINNRGQQDRVPLINIVSVVNYRLRRPESVVVRLKAPSKFGSEVSFMPNARWMPIDPHPIVEELMHRSRGLHQPRE